MIQKIQSNLKKGRYRQHLEGRAFSSYLSAEEDRTDHLLGDRLIFSHRKGEYSPADFPEDLHAHDYYELTLCSKGEGIQYIADRQFLTMQEGISILTKPLAVHMFRPLKRTCYERYVFYFKKETALFEDPIIFHFLDLGSETNAVFSLPPEELRMHCEKIEASLEDRDSPFSVAKACLAIGELFLMLSETGNQKTTSLPPSPAPDFIRRIKEYTDENYTSIRTVEDLSKEFFYSREYISRSFRRYYNTPLYEYILRRKLLLCCRYLKEGLAVEKAALQAGFRNLPSFTKAFRRTYGCTPSEYKAKY